MAAVASHHDKQHLISDEWSEQVEELLSSKEPIEVRRATTRVPTALVNANPDAYIPRVVSLGPHHHHALKIVSGGAFEQPITQMDMYKLKFAREAAGHNTAIIKQMATELTKRPLIKKVEDFYDWSIGDNANELRNFSLMMTVDAFFLFQFLKKYIHDDNCMPSISSVRCDNLKLENQIPLFLLLKVRDAVPAEPQQHKFDLQSGIKSLSTFQIRPAATDIIEGEEHLLGCLHKYVSSFLRIQTAEEDKRRLSRRQRISSKMGSVTATVGRISGRHPATHEGPHGFQKRYNAEELVKAGITFKPFPDDAPCKIRFDKYSRTLYLPQIEVVGSYTEVMLRNLLAMEFNEASRLKAVTNYVAFMDSLIDTPKDVWLLRVSGVIVCQSMMVTDEYVAEMWNGMCKPLLGVAMEGSLLLKSQICELLIQHFYKTRIKTLSGEFRGRYLSKPWEVVALVVRIFLVAVVQFMAVAQYRLGWKGLKCLNSGT